MTFPETNYVQSMALRLAAGAAGLPEEMRTRHTAYLLACQNDDGGFSGRQGASDPYYTGFALRSLMLLGTIDEETAARLARFIGDRLGQPLPCVDFLSLVYAAVLLEAFTGEDPFAAAGFDRLRMVSETLTPLWRDDGGYAKTPRGHQGSTYQTFLAALAMELVGSPPVDPGRTIGLIRSRQCDDGGFVELPRLKYGGTNPTAAAMGLLRLLNAVDEPVRSRASGFLSALQNGEGGFAANTRMPVADLLSTFTALHTLVDLEAVDGIELPAAKRFARSLEQPEGGFLAGAWDDTADVEYTFYGLGTLALLEGTDG